MQENIPNQQTNNNNKIQFKSNNFSSNYSQAPIFDHEPKESLCPTNCATSCHLPKYPVIHKDPKFLELVKNADAAVKKYGLPINKLHVNEHPFLRSPVRQEDNDRIIWNKSPEPHAFIEPIGIANNNIAWHGCNVECHPPNHVKKCDKIYKFEKQNNKNSGNNINNINQTSYQYQADTNYSRVG